MHHIRATLPDIKARITQQLQKYTAELQTLGGPLGDGNSGNVVLSVITEFTSEFRTTIDGNTNDLSLNELSGGARISFVFHELFNQGIKTIDPFDQVKDGDIRTILYNSSVSPLVLFDNFAGHNAVIGIYTITFRRYHRVRSYRQAADQAPGGSRTEMLSTCLRRTHSYPRSIAHENCEQILSLVLCCTLFILPWS